MQQAVYDTSLSLVVEEADRVVSELCEFLESPERLLPGGYLYLTDILGNPEMMNQVGRLFASVFADRKSML